MNKLIVVTYDITCIRGNELIAVEDQLKRLELPFIFVPKGITVEFTKPVEQLNEPETKE